MSKVKQHSLDKVAELISQLVVASKEHLLMEETRSTEQLVLRSEQMKALDRLERLAIKELKSAKGNNSERVWQVVNLVVATVTRYALDRLSDSIRYIQRREHRKSNVAFAHGLIFPKKDACMIGKTIKFLRMAKGIKQTELAKKLSVSANYISLIENDKREPSLSFLKELSIVLDIPVSLLFLDLDMSKKEFSHQERDVLMKMRDLMLQLEMIRLQNSNS